MCCFSGPVRDVSATRIFARHLGGGRQALVYSMNVEVAEELAMVLPLPVAAGAGEDAVSFVDLSGYPTFFRDLADAFPVRRSEGRGLQPAAVRAMPTLAVHDVGDFVASYVPTPRDFDRLDRRFRLSPTVFASRAEYEDYGFAVFQLRPQLRGWFGKKVRKQTVHPMAFSFPSRRPNALFYPTLHVHDGEVTDRAEFDHTLFCQTDDELLARTLPFERSAGPLSRHVDVARAAGFIDGEGLAFRDVVVHEQPNIDFWYAPPACAGPHVLAFKGELFSFRLAATAAYYMQFGFPQARKWRDAAQNKLDTVHVALRDGCGAFLQEMREPWHLVALDHTIEAAALSNGVVWGPTASGWGPLEVGADRALRLSVSSDGEEIEPQQIELAFGRVPSPAVLAQIQRRVNQLLAAALSR